MGRSGFIRFDLPRASIGMPQHPLTFTLVIYILSLQALAIPGIPFYIGTMPLTFELAPFGNDPIPGGSLAILGLGRTG